MVCGLDHLKRRSDFLHVARRGRSRATPGLVVQVCRHERNGTEQPRPLRLGVTVTRKVGNAVKRNRVRRRLRAVARAVIPETVIAGFDCVLIGRAATLDRPFPALIADLQAALRGLTGSDGGNGASNEAAQRTRRG